MDSKYASRLIENTFDIVTVIDRDFKIKYVSSEVLGGEKGSNIIGREFFEICHPEDLPIIKRLLLKLLEDPEVSQKSEFRIKDLSGNWILIESKVRNMLDVPEIHGIVINSREQVYSSRNDSQTNPRQNLTFLEERYHNIFESSKDGIVYSTLKGDLIEVNAAFTKMTGLSRNKLLGMNFKDFTPKRFHNLETHLISKLLETGEPQEYEKPYRRKDGKIVDIAITLSLVKDRDGNPSGLSGVIKDITELKKSRKDLIESEERNRSIIASLHEGILFRDSNGKIRDCNTSAEEILGVKKEQLIGHASICVGDLYKIVDEKGKFLTPEEEPFAICMRTGQPQTSFVMGIVRNNGNVTWVSINNQPVFKSRKKKLHAIVSSYFVITDKKETEEKLRVLNLQLKKSNKELQDFASVASHDLQEPLRKVQTFGDRLKAKESGNLSAEGKEYLERMLTATARMRTLINDLLTFSRVSTMAKPFSRIDLNQIVEGVLSDLEISAEEAGAIITVEDLPSIDCDPTQIRQLFQNLISNALKFKKEGTNPVIEITSSTSKKEFQVGEDFKKKEICTIIIKDNGIGFDNKYVDRIFNVFQRLHSREDYEGTGVGLAVCRKISERHGGTITAKSVIGKGSEFIVTLPVEQNI